MRKFELKEKDCSHNVFDRESEINPDEAWSHCSKCGKDFTQEFVDSLPDPIEPHYPEDTGQFENTP